MAVPSPPATCPSRHVRDPERVNQKEDAVLALNRDQVHTELRAAPSSYRRLIDAATPARLRQRTAGTRWTNQEVYRVSDCGEIRTATFRHGEQYSEALWTFGNCFKSEKDAARAREAIEQVLRNLHTQQT